MTVHLMGAALILSGCGWFGFSMANAYRTEEQGLRQLTRGLEYMECELQFIQTPLPQLLQKTAGVLRGEMSRILARVGQELEEGAWAEVADCMEQVLAERPALSQRLHGHLRQLGQELGQFDLNGQLSSLRALREQCLLERQELARDRQTRLRSYQTLGLCTGAALAVLLL